MKLIYETHSITVDNEQEFATGWLPGELSAMGRQLAKELGERRRDVDVVFSSDLLRAVETVELAGLAVPHLQDWRLGEGNYGAVNGAPGGALAPRVERIPAPFSGGRSYQDGVELTPAFLPAAQRGDDDAGGR